MQCPFCKADEDRVLDSRSIGEGSAIRRRRKCQSCGKRFTTYERPEVAPRVVVKKDSTRELFSRDKMLGGLIKACHKRNISLDDLENVVAKIEAEVYEEHDREVSTKVLGERVSDALKQVDHVAFVRFASVYREFKDVEEFLSELIPLLHAQEGALQGDTRKGSGTFGEKKKESETNDRASLKGGEDSRPGQGRPTGDTGDTGGTAPGERDDPPESDGPSDGLASG